MTDLAVPTLEANRRLDAIDRKILTVLQDDASLSVAEIGDRVGLSSTPCWKRIQRLEADGVILRRVAGRSEQDRARHFGFRVGRERRSFR
jgi:Lrp/AsnC family transcriptional regulator